MPHGQELRLVVGGAGRNDVLTQSTCYKPHEHDELATMSTGTLQNFQGHGWLVEVDPTRPS